MQACNPPDTFFALALLYKPFGKKFVFDQHDLCPEVYESRFPDGSGLVHRALLGLERATYATADHVISTNESYRAVAHDRGGVAQDDVTVVRTGPDPDRLRRGHSDETLKHGARYLCCYLGVMGPQDGVDLAIRSAAFVVHELRRTDIHFTFIGGGDSFDELRALAADLDLGDFVDFTGRVSDDELFAVLSSADLGLCPDPKNPLNDVSTMNKTMEYMSFELPVVAFDLHETRVSADEAAAYVQPNDVELYGKTIVALLDDPSTRAEMGAFGRRRVVEKLAWHHQAEHYVSVYDRLSQPSEP
jgi:glycosyltransferase involved in cell wall biosynthesis